MVSLNSIESCSRNRPFSRSGFGPLYSVLAIGTASKSASHWKWSGRVGEIIEFEFKAIAVEVANPSAPTRHWTKVRILTIKDEDCVHVFNETHAPFNGGKFRCGIAENCLRIKATDLIAVRMQLRSHGLIPERVFFWTGGKKYAPPITNTLLKDDMVIEIVEERTAISIDRWLQQSSTEDNGASCCTPIIVR